MDYASTFQTVGCDPLEVRKAVSNKTQTNSKSILHIDLKEKS